MLEQLPKILEESRRQVERALNSPLKLRAQVSEIVYPNAKDGALFAQVVREDSALRDKSLIALPRGVDRQSSLISLHGSQSKDFSSQILESQSGFTEQAENKTTAKQATAVQGEAEAGFFRNLRILEGDNRGGFEKSASLSLRADKVGVAIHEENAPKTQSVASLEKVDSRGKVDCPPPPPLLAYPTPFI